jgi:DNA polymerase II small subunit
MMQDALREFLSQLSERGALITPEALDYMKRGGDEVHRIKEIIASSEHIPDILDAEDIEQLLGKHTLKKDHPVVEGVKGGEVRILRDVTGNSKAVAKVDSFVATFRDRYERLYSILKGRSSLRNLRKIEKALKMKEDEVSVIGMVREMRETKNGYMITIEDMTGKVDVFFQRKKLREKPLLDEVIGVYGKLSQKQKGRDRIIFGDRILWPDIPAHSMNLSKEKVSVAFLSDLHVGSKTFLKDSWNAFSHWLKTEDAKDIGYIIMAGDVVDGIGIYPDQEEELEILDIYEQYEALAEMVKDISDRIKIVMIPGNHDFVRPSEPQPAFDEEIRKLFSGDIIFAGSPSMLEIEGVKILAYHGTSINDFISVLPGVSYEDPSLALIRMLKSRLLAPIYGGKTPLAPEKEDYMVIDDVPDIFVTGHVHSFVKSVYKGTIVINASTWQSQTKYQKLNNFKPDPGVVAIVDLSTGELREKRFYGGA